MKWQPFLWWVVALTVPAGLQAQNPESAATAVQTQTQSGTVVVSKPVRKPDQVVTNDSIGLLAVRRASRIIATPTAEPVAAKDDMTAEGSEAKKAAEISSLEKQVKDKQTRIALLLKLFADDEKEFLKYGGAAEADPVAQERRRYEQDELRWETAEVAKLQGRIEELKSENKK